MLFGAKEKVEKDLEKIRFTNLSPEKQEMELAEEEKKEKKIKETEYEKGDRFALIVAAFSVVIPYALVFMGILGFAIWLMYLFFFR